MIDLNARLLDAHARDDLTALIALYSEAADTTTDPTARAFYLTHAHVFALELGAPCAEDLRARLIQMGRETPI